MRAVLLDVELAGGPLKRHPATPSGAIPDPATPAHGFLRRPLGANCGLHREVWETLGGFDESYREGGDTEFFWRAQLAGYRLEFAERAVVTYRLRPTIRKRCRKTYRTGQACAQLYRQFRRDGMPRSSLRAGLGRWKRLALSLPRALISPKHGRAWLSTAAWAAGRTVGSVRQRVLYL